MTNQEIVERIKTRIEDIEQSIKGERGRDVDFYTAGMLLDTLRELLVAIKEAK